MTPFTFSALLQRFFTDRLLNQQRASPHTVAGYRDTFRLLLRFAQVRLGRAPSDLRLEELDVPFFGQFLDDLEQNRGNSVRSRNTRLAALRAFFRYVAFTEPSHSHLCQRILSIPTNRHVRHSVEFLSATETTALLAAPNRTTWLGRRDRTLMLVAVQTGLRVSELVSLKQRDVELGRGPHVRCIGKGRKMRCTPLRPDVAAELGSWISEQGPACDSALFPNLHGGSLSSDAVQRLVTRHSHSAAVACPSLHGRTITPHTLRHSAAMALLRNGVDLTVIALWLGHESTETTQIYLHADMELKRRALAHSTSSGQTPPIFTPPDTLLAFLESL